MTARLPRAAVDAAKSDEATRLIKLKQVSLPPIECGDKMVLIAPARGPVIASMPIDVVRQPDGSLKDVPAGYRHWKNARRMDVFDRMNKSADSQGVPRPFSNHQIDVARAYRDLVEQVSAQGYKASSAFNTSAGGGGPLDTADIYAQKAERLQWALRQIGTGVAKQTRRVRPSKAGRVTLDAGAVRRINRVLITRLDLINLVCLQNKSLTAVLRRFHWSGSTENRKTIGHALRAILDDLGGI